jgi:hypothetical protein
VDDVNLPTLLAVLLALALLAWYVSFSASRLDRLHHRVEGARNALDAQLVRRAEASIELATSGALDLASGLLLADAASRALEAGESDAHVPADLGGARLSASAGTEGTRGEREAAESDLSRTLRATLDGDVPAVLAADPRFGPLLARLGAAAHRVRLARRFLNGAVTDAQRVRGKLLVRWTRLAGRAELPRTFEMDDDPPAELAH